jgi:2-oxoglutarate ferredoxin oxidoreductase subunit beta
VFGQDGASCVVRDDFAGELRIAETSQVDAAEIVVHDVTRPDPSYAFALSRLSSQDLRYTPMGVFRAVQRPTYDRMMADQIEEATTQTRGDLASLLAGSDTWVVPAP